VSSTSDSLLGVAVGLVVAGVAIGVTKAVMGKDAFNLGSKAKDSKEWFK